MALLTRIEEIISIPLELFHQRKGFHPVDLNRMALRCMEQGTRKGIRQVYAPNTFTVLLNPSDFRDLHPFLGTIGSDIKGELRRVAEERSYLLAGDLSVTLTTDEETPEGKPQVRGSMQGEAEPVSTVMLSDIHTQTLSAPDNVGRDAPTVILLPVAAHTTDVPAENGLSPVGQRQLDAPTDGLVDTEPEKDAAPRLLRTVAMMMELLGNRSRVSRMERKLKAIDGPGSDIQRCIGHLVEDTSRDAESDAFEGQSGQLILGATGACIRCGKDSFILENPGKQFHSAGQRRRLPVYKAEKMATPFAWVDSR
jgi:hypothetical protein